MFLSDSHLPQLLRPEHYTSREQFERERQLFLPAWHPVGITARLPSDGDSFTFDLLEHPLIVTRAGGTIQSFLDAWPQHVRSTAVRNLKPLATETCGQMIFVNLSETPPSLREYLGEGYDLAERVSTTGRVLSFSMSRELDANWKTRMENALEDYHFETVHPTTLGCGAPPEDISHERRPGGSLVATTVRPAEGMTRVLDEVVHRLASAKFDNFYRHQLHYPSLVFGDVRLFGLCENCLPLSPGRCVTHYWYFCYRGRDRLKNRLLEKCLRAWQKRFFTKIVDEDDAIVQEVYRGVCAPRRPDGGVISIREERLYDFQKYILEATGQSGRITGATPDPPTDPGRNPPAPIRGWKPA